jgi:hypothetical protein
VASASVVTAVGAVVGVQLGRQEDPPDDFFIAVVAPSLATLLALTFGITVLRMVSAASRERAAEAAEVARSRERLENAESDVARSIMHRRPRAQDYAMQARLYGTEVRPGESVEELRDRLRALRDGIENDVPNEEPEPGTGQGEAPEPGTSPSVALLSLSALWEATHARLHLYHDLALRQAGESFRSAKWAMWAGFVALGGFVLAALWASTTAGSIVAGGLGAVAAGLAGFIGKTFVRSQEMSAEHLRSYFDQPLEHARYLAAERLIADAKLSDEQRAEILTALVTAMVSSPQQSADQPGGQLGFPWPAMPASVPGQANTR